MKKSWPLQPRFRPHVTLDEQHASPAAEHIPRDSSATDHADEIRGEQIALVYRQLPIALVTTVIIAFLTAFTLWDHVSHAAIVGWLIFVNVLTSSRYVVLRAYHRASPTPREARYWGRLSLIAIGLAGASWGMLATLLFPADSLTYQAFIGAVLAGMSAASLTTLSPYPGAGLAFLLLALLPYAVRLMMENEPTQIAMGTMTLLFIVMMRTASRRLHLSFRDALRLRFENAELLRRVRCSREQQAAANRDLQAEIVEKGVAQAALQEREALVHAILHSLSASIAVVDGVGRVISINRAWQAQALKRDDPLLSGVMLATDYRAHCAAVAHRDPVAVQVCAEVESMLRRDASEAMIEYRRRQAATEDKWYRMWITQLQSAQGGAVISRLNITQRKQAEERLLLAAVFENTNEAIFILDTRLRIVAVNKAFAEITGYRAVDAVGKRPNWFHPYRQNSRFYASLRHAIRDTDQWQGETVGWRKDGADFPVSGSLTSVRDDQGGTTHYIVVFSDITERKATERHLHQLAYRDALTGLPNRGVLRERLKHALAQARRHGWRVAVMFLDLDRFKLMNDTLGHEAGDRLLQEVALRLKRCVREEDTVARLGGDEFTVVLEQATHSRNVGKIARKILRTLAQPRNLSDQEVYTSASIGISIYPDDGDDENGILKNADTAMYRAKEQGGNRYQFYTAEMNTVALERIWIESNLRRAILRNELQLVYQPIVRTGTGEIYKCEALLRWQHPERGCILPGEFIPIAEDTGLIVPISEWVLRQVCNQLQEWEQYGLPAVTITINISARQFRSNSMRPALAQSFRQARLAPARLEIELTESSLVTDRENAVAILKQLHELGIRIALDDFGTGYSSLSFLKRFPIDVVKIDRSFIADITTDSDDAAIASAIIAMAHSLKLEVVAEGVETAEQLALLRRWDCDAVQGYYLSPPLTAERFMQLVQGERKLVGAPSETFTDRG